MADLVKAIFLVKWKDGLPDFKKTPVGLTDGGYSAFECSPKHNGADKVQIWIKAEAAKIEDLKNWIDFVRYVEDDE